MSDKNISSEEQMLIDAKGNTGATVKTYLKLSGPGWLQSAITLGGGSLAGALFLGVIGGTEFLWIQLAAMILGVIMLSAISYVTLSSGQSPYKLIRDNVNPVLAWGWLIVSLMANMIWVMPQYAMSHSAITENLGISFGSEMTNKVVISLLIFAFCTALVMTYGKGGKGQKIFDISTKVVVAAIVVTFMVVTCKIIFIDETFSIGQIFAGFIPSISHFTEPVGAIGEQIAKLDPAVQGYWKSQVIDIQQTVLIASAAFAVGVNMTFMMPFSLISRGWNKNFRGLAIFDLATGMLIPFILATSCVAIASAAAFHGKSQGAIVKVEGKYQVNPDASGKVKGGLNGILKKRNSNEALKAVPVSEEEMVMASFLIKRDTGSFTKALEGTVGKTMANLIFGLGVLAMGLSTITMLMLISGFCVCEIGGFEHGGKQHKMGTLLASTGLLWFVVWTQGSAPYLAAVTGTFGYIFLPIAYIAFFLLFNSKKAMGENMPVGSSKIKWNILMGIAVVITSAAALGPYGAWGKKLNGFYIGRWFVGAFIVLAIIGHFYMVSKNKKEANASSDAAE